MILPLTAEFWRSPSLWRWMEIMEEEGVITKPPWHIGTQKVEYATVQAMRVTGQVYALMTLLGFPSLAFMEELQCPVRSLPPWPNKSGGGYSFPLEGVSTWDNKSKGHLININWEDGLSYWVLMLLILGLVTLPEQLFFDHLSICDEGI